MRNRCKVCGVLKTGLLFFWLTTHKNNHRNWNIRSSPCFLGLEHLFFYSPILPSLKVAFIWKKAHMVTSKVSLLLQLIQRRYKVSPPIFLID